MELFEQIRRDRKREGLGIRALARRRRGRRRAVRRALASPLPPKKRPPSRRPAPKVGPQRQQIDEWLLADQKAPRKQRPTARRIYQRLRDEHVADVAESTVRAYVRRRRHELMRQVEDASGLLRPRFSSSRLVGHVASPSSGLDVA